MCYDNKDNGAQVAPDTSRGWGASPGSVSAADKLQKEAYHVSKELDRKNRAIEILRLHPELELFLELQGLLNNHLNRHY